MPGITGTPAEKHAALATSVQKVAESYTVLAQAATAATAPLTNLQLAMKSSSEFAKALRDSLEGSGWRVNEGSTPTEAQTAYTRQIERQLQEFENRLKAVFGDNNQVAQLIDRNLQRLNSGEASPEAVLQTLRGILGAYLPGLAQELFSQDPAIRALALELEQFIQSGSLPNF